MAQNKILPYDLTGNPQSKNMVIFLHGWPDSNKLWEGVIAQLQSAEPDCMKVAISYPNYDSREQSKWGVEIPELMLRIKHTIDTIDAGQQRSKVLVGHDWGSFFTFSLDKMFPNYFSSMVSLDVTPFRPKPTLKSALMILFYQWFNIFTFMLPFGGDFLMRLLLRAFKYPYDLNQTSSRMNYMYYNIWKMLLTQTFNKTYKDFLNFRGYKPSCPVSYMYGKDKPFHFHNEKFLAMMEENGNEKHMVKGGHWIMLKHTPQIVQIIQNRLKSNGKK